MQMQNHDLDFYEILLPLANVCVVSRRVSCFLISHSRVGDLYLSLTFTLCLKLLIDLENDFQKSSLACSEGMDSNNKYSTE